VRLLENRTTIQVSEDLRKQLKVLAARRDISYQELLQDMISVFKELNQEKTIISIPSMLADKVNDKIQKTDFASVSDYTTFVLRQMLMESADKQKISASDEERIKDKLRKLGYL
jgi:Arc/MetJ-type ribon-helix-helix transcriptional regulator